MTTTYSLRLAGCTVTFDEAIDIRVSEATARFDATYTVPAGTYPLRPITIGGEDCPIEDAYFFHAALPGTLKAGGFPDQTIGVTTRTVGFTPYGYLVRAQAAKAQAPE